MKTKYYILVCLLAISFSFAQTLQEKKEKIKALKVAYLTEKLDLSTEEAQKFWPVYNAFNEKQFEIRHNKVKSLMKNLDEAKIENLNEAEAKNLITQMEASEDEMHLLKKKFITDLQKVLPAKKMILLRKYEDEFNRNLLKQFRERK